MTRPDQLIKKFPVTAYFALTFLLVWLGMALNISGLFPPFGERSILLDGRVTAVFRTRLTLMNWFPNIAAAVILGVTGGWGAVRQLFVRFLRWRTGLLMWAMAIFLPAITAILAVVFYRLAGGYVDLSRVDMIPAVLGIRFLFALTAEGVGGEAGWRGFAQEHLQRKYPPIAAALIVGLFWGLIHLPIVTIRGFDLTETLCFMAIIIGLSIVLAWFYNRSKGSLLIVALVHCLFDAFDATFSRSFAAMVLRKSYLLTFTGVLTTAVLIIIAATYGRLGISPAKGK